MPAQIRVSHPLHGSGWTDALLRGSLALVQFDSLGWLKVQVADLQPVAAECADLFAALRGR